MKSAYALLAAVLLGSATFSAQAATTHQPSGIAWQKGDVPAAFAQAKAAKKPLFLYWGAGWCPPCNQVKATIFNQEAFIERTRQFIPVYLDGDSPDAQKLGAQFKVRGYPTMILFKPDGTEITRLPGEVDADRYLKVLTLGLTAARPVKATLAAALVDGSKLAADEWRLLADYSWDTDEAQLVAPDKLAATLQKLARSVPAQQADIAARLQLKALAAAGNGKDAAVDKAAGLTTLTAVLANPRLTRDNFDVLVNYAPDIVATVTAAKSAPRAQLLAGWQAALQKLSSDGTLSTADRLGAVIAQISLAQLDKDKEALPPALLKTVRERVAQADKATTNGYERHVVISTAADALSSAGLLDESDKLLQAELKRSQSPYYFMLALAGNAKERGDKVAALNWYEQAYHASEGPATRLQWGVTYINGIIELSPQDDARLDKAVQSVFKELGESQNVFYERNRRSLEKLVSKLAAWNKGKQHEASIKLVQTRIEGLCSKLPASDPQRVTCLGLLKPKA
ncbi:thioredoxin family protein [Chitinimonas arctica]|uniref:Thioredoxin family protein n=1 Tax=Chitinimonas arctica TaxID=2594795 RepID=A0A516SD19_9NEIS|nr:thioredoxin family protein [Chitinimonas arctica]QDQ26041.1 thioredoxin family protein [Chitinimonas arctica]